MFEVLKKVGSAAKVKCHKILFLLWIFLRIDALNQYDAKKTRREGALNALESAVIETRTRMEEAEFSEFAKPEEAQTIQTKSKEVLHNIT